MNPAILIQPNSMTNSAILIQISTQNMNKRKAKHNKEEKYTEKSKIKLKLNSLLELNHIY